MSDHESYSAAVRRFAAVSAGVASEGASSAPRVAPRSRNVLRFPGARERERRAQLRTCAGQRRAIEVVRQLALRSVFAMSPSTTRGGARHLGGR